MKDTPCPSGCVLYPGAHPDTSEEVKYLPGWEKRLRPGLVHCECGRTYRLVTLLDRERWAQTDPQFFVDLSPLTPYQRHLSVLMRENGLLRGRKKRKLFGTADGDNSQSVWVDVSGPEATDYLEQNRGGWHVPRVRRLIVYPPTKLVRAVAEHLDGFGDVEALRAQFVRGRPKNPELRRKAVGIVADLKKQNFKRRDIAEYLGVSEKTIRCIKRPE